MPTKPRQLSERERKTHELLEIAADYTWRIDSQGLLRELTTRGGKPLQYRPSELAGKALSDLVDEDERQAMARRLAARLATRTAFSQIEFTARRKDGSELPLEISGVPIFDHRGRFAGYRGTARDITERRSAQRELAYGERLMSLVTRVAADLISSDHVGAAMPQALRLFGETLKADRVMVLENNNEDPPSAVNRLYGWQSPAVKHQPGMVIENPIFNTPEVGRWLAALRTGETAVVSADTATGMLAQVLEVAQAKTILFVPILAEGRWWGSVCVDQCDTPRTWRKSEIDALKTFAEIAGGAIMRERHASERRRMEEELTLRLRRDPLTGLANRKLFREMLEIAMGDARNGRGGFAIHYLDLDHFKDVNDTLGHPIGDLLLQAVADRIRGVTRHTDVVARFGGDEFAVLQAAVESPKDADTLARKVLEALKAPIFVEGRELHIGASIGVALYEPDAAKAETLLAHAELALYRAKSEGRRTHRFFAAAMDVEARERVALTEELRSAIADKQFFLVYQPQVDMEGGRITGVEALVRWRHPTRGIVSPTDFIPGTEANGLIVQLGDWILRDAVRQTKAWLDAGLAPPSVSVNMSAVQFRRPAELQQEVAAIVREAGIPSGLLQLELTETTLMEASKAQEDVLARFHRSGLKISLDDFGTGYSSLDYLRRYPVDQIKIAQVFVGGITCNPGDAAIVRAAIGLARELGLRIVAEGVEHAAQARLLAGWGCREVQGYYYSPPVSAAEFEAMLRAGFVRPAARTLAVVS